jgi:predicted HicB family RNase H-like nuclease
MEYKGYIGKVDYDDEAGIFHGEVVNLRDVITFVGESVSELRQAFQDSIDDYLAFCAERNEPPEKPFSGTFTVRLAPELHRAAASYARLQNKSLNSYVNELIEHGLREASQSYGGSTP